MDKMELAFITGMLALSAVLLWRSQSNPPPIHIGGIRIHHGLVGAAIGAAGILSKKPYLVTAALPLVLDDIADMPQWLNFKD